MDGAAPTRLGTARMLARALRRRCPRCGGGGLFPTWFTIVERCPTCSFRFNREEGFFLGAFVVNFAATEALLAAVLAVGFALTLPDPPLGRIIAIGVVLTTVFPIAFYPFSKTVWAAIDIALFGRDAGA